MALVTGANLGPYEILGPAGAGGMGEVYRARDTRLDRTVAIKILPSAMAASSGARQRFEREAKAISSLSHPHICQLYDVGKQDGLEFLVLEYLEGETLEHRLTRGRLPIEHVLRYGKEIADALEKAHAKGLIHRDLKPGNIMLTKSGAKLLDFGLAKPLHSGISSVLTAITQERPLTAEGTIVGTYHYMAPEQIEGHEADARSDIFSLGAVLYEMATGKRAFDGRTQATVIAAVLERDPEPITSVQPMSPPVLDQIVRTCLHKDPDERFQTAHDLRLQLQWIAGGLMGSTATGTAVQPKASSRQSVLLRYAWPAVAIVAVIAAIAAWFLARRPAENAFAAPMRFQISAPAAADFASADQGAVEVSPDNSKLVFSAQANGKTSLWVRPLESLDARQLPGTEGALYPFWSPDGRSVGFFIGNKLKRVSIGGGDPETIATVEHPLGGTWSSKGFILVGSQADAIYKVADAGGTPQKLTTLNAARHETTHRWPSMLPDGDHFLFECGTADPNAENQICGASLDSPQAKAIVAANSNARYASGYLFYFHESGLHAHPFNPDTLAVTGSPVHIVERVSYDPVLNRAIFSVTNQIISYEPTTGSAEDASADEKQAEQTKSGPAKSPVTVLTDWRTILAKMQPDND